MEPRGVLKRIRPYVPPILLAAGAVFVPGAAGVAIGVWAASGLVVMDGLLRPRSQTFGRNRFRGSSSTGIALTFDDGPHLEDTPALLDILGAAGVRATFFLVGERARRCPDLARRVAEAGHEIGSHSHTHPHLFSLIPRRRLQREIHESVEGIQEVTGRRPALFRPPMGHKNAWLPEVLAAEGLTMVTWSTRTLDTWPRPPEKLCRVALRRLEPGGILLLHEGVRRAAGVRSRTVEALPGLLKGMKERGLDPVTVGELLAQPG